MSGDEVSAVEMILALFVGSFAIVTGIGLGLGVMLLIARGVARLDEYGEYVLKELKYKVQKRENGKIDDYC